MSGAVAHRGRGRAAADKAPPPRDPTMSSHPPEMIRPMTRQLELLLEPEDDDWRLDEHTREAGRRGVAEARRVLAEVTKRSAA